MAQIAAELGHERRGRELLREAEGLARESPYCFLKTLQRSRDKWREALQLTDGASLSLSGPSVW